MSTATFSTSRDVIGIRVEGSGPNHVCVACFATRQSPVIDAFVDAVVSLVPSSGQAHEWTPAAHETEPVGDDSNF
ncbi:hypothetical protein [Amycolatopsis sp. NBRC 101858]|uniref:hypothetical protein n=1 Tax=Amycolatopsis sp. NBRC 101858 TaxID=3032200 RepID=UPI0025556A67|nr:hypothetical protein [Amycolatopsis sp. NBRC 101858]